STYADPARAGGNAAEQALYQQINADIQMAVNVGDTIIADHLRDMPAAQRAETGNLRGMLGWVTYLAFYLRRGTIPEGQLGGTVKNIAPILLKSPNRVFTTYGMTPGEITYFTSKREKILNAILAGVGRPSDQKSLQNLRRAFSKVDVFSAAPGSASV